MLSFLQKLLQKPVFVYIGVFIVLLFCTSTRGNGVVVDSNFALSFDPIHSYKDFFSAWSNTYYFGISNEPVYSYIFPVGFLYWLGAHVFPMQIVQQLVLSAVLLTAFIGFNEFITAELEKRSLYGYVGALLYTFNMYTLLSVGTTAVFFPYAMLPIQLLFIKKIFTEKSHIVPVIGFSFATLIMSGINPPLSAINLVAQVFYFFHLFSKQKLSFSFKKFLSVLGLTIGIVVTTNLYWIIGVIDYYSSISTKGFAAVLSEPLSMQNAASTYLNVFRNLGIWSFGGGAGGVLYYNYSDMYLKNYFFEFSLYTIPLVIFMGIYIYHKQLQKFKNIILLLFFSIAMVVGSRQGFLGPIYIWSYQHVPLFSMFRSGYKFTTLVIFALSFLLVVILTSIKEKRNRLMVTYFSLGIILINALPFFTGRIYQQIKQIKSIPSYYYDAKQFFDTDKSSYRIFLLPEQYFATYYWGFTAGNPETMWEKGLVARQAGSELEQSNEKTLKLYSGLFDKNYVKANLLMNELNVKYIVQRNDFNWQFYRNISQSPEFIKDVLAPYKKVATYGKLDIYQLPSSPSQSALIESDSVQFQKIDSVTYVITLSHISTSTIVRFLESYDPKWMLYPLPQALTPTCSTLVYSENGVNECSQNEKTKIPFQFLLTMRPYSATHRVYANYANEWVLNKNDIERKVPSSYYHVNSDGTITTSFLLFFKPQLYFYMGIFVSAISTIACLVYLTIHFLHKKKYV